MVLGSVLCNEVLNLFFLIDFVIDGTHLGGCALIGSLNPRAEPSCYRINTLPARAGFQPGAQSIGAQ